jgi:hypothetical protein
MMATQMETVMTQDLTLSAVDEAAFRQIAKTLQDAWNAGDGQLFAADFAPNANYTVWNGTIVEGKEQIAAGHQHIFDTVYKNTNAGFDEGKRPLANRRPAKYACYASSIRISGVRHEISSGREMSDFMPWRNLSSMTNEELQALWLYLQSLRLCQTTKFDIQLKKLDMCLLLPL